MCAIPRCKTLACRSTTTVAAHSNKGLHQQKKAFISAAISSSISPNRSDTHRFTTLRTSLSVTYKYMAAKARINMPVKLREGQRRGPNIWRRNHSERSLIKVTLKDRYTSLLRTYRSFNRKLCSVYISAYWHSGPSLKKVGQ